MDVLDEIRPPAALAQEMVDDDLIAMHPVRHGAAGAGRHPAPWVGREGSVERGELIPAPAQQRARNPAFVEVILHRGEARLGQGVGRAGQDRVEVAQERRAVGQAGAERLHLGPPGRPVVAEGNPFHPGDGQGQVGEAEDPPEGRCMPAHAGREALDPGRIVAPAPFQDRDQRGHDHHPRSGWRRRRPAASAAANHPRSAAQGWPGQPSKPKP